MGILRRTYKAAKGIAALQIASKITVAGLGLITNALDPEARIVRRLHRDDPVGVDVDSEDEIPIVEETI